MATDGTDLPGMDTLLSTATRLDEARADINSLHQLGAQSAVMGHAKERRELYSTHVQSFSPFAIVRGHGEKDYSKQRAEPYQGDLHEGLGLDRDQAIHQELINSLAGLIDQGTKFPQAAGVSGSTLTGRRKKWSEATLGLMSEAVDQINSFAMRTTGHVGNAVMADWDKLGKDGQKAEKSKALTSMGEKFTSACAKLNQLEQEYKRELEGIAWKAKHGNVGSVVSRRQRVIRADRHEKDTASMLSMAVQWFKIQLFLSPLGDL